MRIYKYGCKPIGGFNAVPQAFFEEAAGMNELWNWFVLLNDICTQRYYHWCRSHSPEVCSLEAEKRDLMKSIQRVDGLFKLEKQRQNKQQVKLLEASKNELKKEYKKISEALREERRVIAKKTKYGARTKNVFWSNFRALYDEYKNLGLMERSAEGVKECFKNARKASMKGDRMRPKEKGPFSHYKHLRLVMRFNDSSSHGGLLVEKLFNESRKIHIKPGLDRKNRTKLRWMIRDVECWFRLTLHPWCSSTQLPTTKLVEGSLPADSKVQQIYLLKEFHKWHLCVVVKQDEIKHKREIKKSDVPVVFSPRWSEVPSKNDIVIGEIWFEDESSPRLVKLFDTVDFHNQPCKRSFLERIEQMRRLNEKADRHIVKAKEILFPFWPGIRKQIGSHTTLTSCHAKGLNKIVKAIRENLPGYHPVADKVKAEVNRYYIAFRAKKGVEQHLIGHREHCYWNFGKWLSLNASHIYLVDIGLKRLGRRKEIEDVPVEVAEHIRRNMRYVAHGSLYQKIREEARKVGIPVETITSKEKGEACSWTKTSKNVCSR